MSASRASKYQAGASTRRPCGSTRRRVFASSRSTYSNSRQRPLENACSKAVRSSALGVPSPTRTDSLAGRPMTIRRRSSLSVRARSGGKLRSSFRRADLVALPKGREAALAARWAASHRETTSSTPMCTSVTPRARSRRTPPPGPASASMGQPRARSVAKSRRTERRLVSRRSAISAVVSTSLERRSSRRSITRSTRVIWCHFLAPWRRRQGP